MADAGAVEGAERADAVQPATVANGRSDGIALAEGGPAGIAHAEGGFAGIANAEGEKTLGEAILSERTLGARNPSERSATGNCQVWMASTRLSVTSAKVLY